MMQVCGIEEGSAAMFYQKLEMRERERRAYFSPVISKYRKLHNDAERTQEGPMREMLFGKLT